jgi:hypothetical protein
MLAQKDRPETTGGQPRKPRRGRGLSAVAFVIAAVLLVAAAVVVLKLADIGLTNPFSETARENPNAVVLAELRDQSRYVAASGRFQTLIDSVQDADYLPDALKGSRELFVAEGEVDGSVDLAGLTEADIKVSEDGKVLTIYVPPAQLGRPRIDPDATRLVSRERGIFDRLGDALGGGDPSNQQALYQRAEQKISEAAARSELSKRTEENTTKFLQSLFGGLGYQDVRVVFKGQTAEQR